MENNFYASGVSGYSLEHIGWKYYNTIKKKAMEQEFSWSGLLISVSIAFFVVMAAAFCLGHVYNYFEKAGTYVGQKPERIYHLEGYNTGAWENYLETDYISSEKFNIISNSYIA